MAILVYILFFMALTGHPTAALYCVCRDGVGDSNLQKSIDYACGAGADCTAILQNGACYNPNTVKDHCNYAVNSYFQKMGQTSGSCNFSGTATTTQNQPSTSSTCVYPSSASSTSPGTGTGTGTGTSTGTGTGTGTGTSPSVFGISPSSTTGTGFNDNGVGIALLEETKLLFSFVFTFWLAMAFWV